MAVNRWALLSSKVLDNTVTLDIDSDTTDNKSERSENTDDTEVVSIVSDQYSSSDQNTCVSEAFCSPWCPKMSKICIL